MDFSWSEEQQQLRNATIDFATKELSDDLIARDKSGEFPHDLWKKCAGFGIQGLPFPREYGGQDADILTTTLAMEALGYACKDNGLLFALNAQKLLASPVAVKDIHARIVAKYGSTKRPRAATFWTFWNGYAPQA